MKTDTSEKTRKEPDMEKKLIVINPGLEEELLEKIRTTARQTGCEIAIFNSEEEAGDPIMEAEIIYGHAPKAARQSDHLKWICIPWAGADAFCAPGAIKHAETLLTNSAGAFGLTLSEHALMLTLMLLRREPTYAAAVQENVWLRPVLPQRSIKDSRITLLGAGDIGRHIARRLVPFEPACITAVSRSGKSDEPSFDEMLPQSRLEEVLPRTDVLIMSLPSTPETIDILNERTLSLLPRNAYIVNVGRGTAIDEPALIHALETEQIAGAALDVTKTEPLPAEDPLWKTKNLLLTPHVAGNFAVAYTRQRNVEMFCEDLLRYAEGKPLLHLVDRSLGY